MRILVVDDSKAMRLIVARTLRQAGFGDHEVLEATNGVEAFDVIRREEPDLVLSDWNMPEMTGLELLEFLRLGGNTVPFGFVTSETSAEMRETALGAGAWFLIGKPFTPDSFRETLGPLLEVAS